MEQKPIMRMPSLQIQFHAVERGDIVLKTNHQIVLHVHDWNTTGEDPPITSAMVESVG